MRYKSRLKQLGKKCRTLVCTSRVWCQPNTVSDVISQAVLTANCLTDVDKNYIKIYNKYTQLNKKKQLWPCHLTIDKWSENELIAQLPNPRVTAESYTTTMASVWWFIIQFHSYTQLLAKRTTTDPNNDNSNIKCSLDKHEQIPCLLAARSARLQHGHRYIETPLSTLCTWSFKLQQQNQFSIT